MSKLRSVNTRFWEDPFIEELKPEEKLLFLYFLTNPSTNLTGIYEISIRRISNDTGLTQDRIKKALKGFERVGKVYYFESYVFLPNFIKNQSFNGNMKKGAVKDFNTLPKWLREKFVDKPLESFESLLNALKIEFNLIEDEYKEESIKKQSIFEMYKEWLNESSNERYKLFVEWFLAGDFQNCMKLDDHLDEARFMKISSFSNEQIKQTIDNMENHKLLTKKYTSFYRTLNNWLKR